MRVLHDISGWHGVGLHAVAINICASKTCWKSCATAMRATPTDSNTLLLWLWAVNRMYRLWGRAQRAQAMSTPINWPRNSRQWKCVGSNWLLSTSSPIACLSTGLNPNKNISHSQRYLNAFLPIKFQKISIAIIAVIIRLTVGLILFNEIACYHSGPKLQCFFSGNAR